MITDINSCTVGMMIECQKKINVIERGTKYYKCIIQRIRVPFNKIDVKYCTDNSEDLGVPLSFCRYETICTTDNYDIINKKLINITKEVNELKEIIEKFKLVDFNMEKANKYVNDTKKLYEDARNVCDLTEYDSGLVQNAFNQENILDLPMIKELIEKFLYYKDLQQFKEDYFRCKQDIKKIIDSQQEVTNNESDAKTALDFAKGTVSSINYINSHSLLKVFLELVALSEEDKVTEVETIKEVVIKQKDTVEAYSFSRDFIAKVEACSNFVETNNTTYTMTDTADFLYEYQNVQLISSSIESEIELLKKARDNILVAQQNCNYEKCITLLLIPTSHVEILTAVSVKIEYLSWLLTKKKALGKLFQAVYEDNVKAVSKIVAELKIDNDLSDVVLVADDTLCLGSQGFQWECPSTSSHGSNEYSCCNVKACLNKSKCLCECDICVPYWMEQRGQRYCQFQFCDLCNNCESIKLEKCKTCEGIDYYVT